MRFYILIPHYQNGKATAYAVYKLLQCTGKHEIKIIVIDNNSGDGSIEYLRPFGKYITVLNYPKGIQQSHGASFDYVLMNGYVTSDYFITMESDSFPIRADWLDYYENLINNDFDSAGSVLELSGGCYLHPCGAMYKKSNWDEAKKYCEEIPYSYFPNMSAKEGFDFHLMIHNSILENFLENPEDWIHVAKGYWPYSKQKALERLQHYKPITRPFHNGMGGNNESIKTFGKRTFNIDVPNTLIKEDSRKIINRVGMEPGQWLSYWHVATNKKIHNIPTEIKWMPNREKQQQEYTLTNNGFKHLWAGSAYLGMKDTEFNDVYEFKKNQIEILYNSLPEKYKIQP